MERKFVIMPVFKERWNEMGFGDAELLNLQADLLIGLPSAKPLRGTGKLYKRRFILHQKKSKRSSKILTHILYVNYVVSENIYLIYVYPKKEDYILSNRERNGIKELIERIEHRL